MWAIDLFKAATFRVAVFFALAVTACTSVVFLFIYWQVAIFDINRLDVILVGEVARAIAQPEDRVQRELELRFTSDLRKLDYAALFDKGGKLRYGNVDAIPAGLPIDGKAHTVQARTPRGTMRMEPAVFVAGKRPDGGIVLLGRSLYEVYALRQVVIKALAIGIVPAILLALATGTVFSLRATRRLKTINETIVRIMRGDLQERLPTHGKMDDLNYVASAVNLMLDEIVRLLNQLKSVGDNIAHDLRAPLAVMHAKLERGLAGQSDQDLRIAAKRALGDLDHALATVSALLRISEIEFGRRRSAFTSLNLAEVCANVFELYQPLAEAKEIGFTLEVPESLPILGDFDLLVEAVANLVDNAIKFTPRGGFVAVTAKPHLAGFLVRVSDNGPGIAPFEREQVFKRFYRAKNCRDIPGTGLGLSMAATIATLHGFDLRVEDNQPGAAFVISPRQVRSA
ncbi:HAMP domain-containing sensor histidine kinase [Methylocapsa sp. D3K7]|uniref:sensor histidine kinase n=1 Tax=Methylocapsa sp. D3K7 TaxID=3041435 RepID=UPI00244EAD16|nr:HAMP domain-containing sensor histidine kinase [Methylocapsa sp. D3K7]WGJ14546.1 HAMP domain-containing sensor histidine kinase [Methylocapsa sp. D3K7]